MNGTCRFSPYIAVAAGAAPQRVLQHVARVTRASLFQAVNDLVTELEQANITCTATITFAENDYKEQLRTLKVKSRA